MSSAPPTPRRFDGADGVIVLGFLAFTGGIALLSVPWALIVAGVLLVVAGVRLGGNRGPAR